MIPIAVLSAQTVAPFDRQPWLEDLAETRAAVSTKYAGLEWDVFERNVDFPDAVIFLFASENEGGAGLIARGLVTQAEATPKKRGVARQTPRVSISVKRTAIAKRTLGRAEVKGFAAWKDGRPQTEIDFKFYRQTTDKIVGLSAETAAYLEDFF